MMRRNRHACQAVDILLSTYFLFGAPDIFFWGRLGTTLTIREHGSKLAIVKDRRARAVRFEPYPVHRLPIMLQ